MKEQNIKTIREAVIKAVPEVVELKFGCEVKYIPEGGNPLPLHTVLGRNDNRTIRTETYGELNEQDIKIIGRPIRLADVLLALDEDNKEETQEGVVVNTNGDMAILVNKDNTAVRSHRNPFIFNWNLRKDSLTEQSEETLQFLADLLK